METRLDTLTDAAAKASAECIRLRRVLAKAEDAADRAWFAVEQEREFVAADTVAAADRAMVAGLERDGYL
jgi:hypothetical protein